MLVESVCIVFSEMHFTTVLQLLFVLYFLSISRQFRGSCSSRSVLIKRSVILPVVLNLNWFSTRFLVKEVSYKKCALSSVNLRIFY